MAIDTPAGLEPADDNKAQMQSPALDLSMDSTGVSLMASPVLSPILPLGDCTIISPALSLTQRGVAGKPVQHESTPETANGSQGEQRLAESRRMFASEIRRKDCWLAHDPANVSRRAAVALHRAIISA